LKIKIIEKELSLVPAISECLQKIQEKGPDEGTVAGPEREFIYSPRNREPLLFLKNDLTYLVLILILSPRRKI
jgi:hypothetical protein